MENKFDLTTKKGLGTALACLSVINPVAAAGAFIVNKFINSEATKDQGKVVEDLIRKGKEQGVTEMEITLDNKKGINFSCPIEDAEIKTMVGNAETTTIKVKFK